MHYSDYSPVYISFRGDKIFVTEFEPAFSPYLEYYTRDFNSSLEVQEHLKEYLNFPKHPKEKENEAFKKLEKFYPEMFL